MSHHNIVQWGYGYIAKFLQDLKSFCCLCPFAGGVAGISLEQLFCLGEVACV